MARTPLTLAALATSAVPGLTVAGVREHRGSGDDEFHSAVLETERGMVIIRVPRNGVAEVRQSSELLGLSALSEGARASLPFDVPRTLGVTRAGDTRAVVTSFLSGWPLERLTGQDEDAEDGIESSLAQALAAIHALPTSLVHDAGLPVRSAEEARHHVHRLVERAVSTHLVPETVHQRWREALGRAQLWDFAPVVVHGSLSLGHILQTEDRVSGVLGWDALAVDDPALDFAWLLGSGEETLAAVHARYAALSGTSGVREAEARAHLYHQLEVAKWLLHGVDTHDAAIVEDAVAMFDRLVDRLSHLGEPVPARHVLGEREVARLLDEVPELPVDPRSETAEFESLDEGREFDRGSRAGDEPPREP